MGRKYSLALGSGLAKADQFAGTLTTSAGSFYFMPGHDDGIGGVRSGGTEQVPTWHTLESFIALRNPPKWSWRMPLPKSGILIFMHRSGGRRSGRARVSYLQSQDHQREVWDYDVGRLPFRICTTTVNGSWLTVLRRSTKMLIR